jgi:hypothetical protein
VVNGISSATLYFSTVTVRKPSGMSDLGAQLRQEQEAEDALKPRATGAAGESPVETPEE